MRTHKRVDITSAHFKADPFSFYERLRREQPVSSIALPNGTSAWMGVRQGIRGDRRSCALPSSPLRLCGRSAFVELYDAGRRGKEVMASVPNYLLNETAFTIVQWALVAPLTVAAFSLQSRYGRRLGTIG